MPLPVKDQAWPPADLNAILDKQAEHNAWYSNQTDKLAGVYSGQERSNKTGLLQRIGRYFWSNRSSDLTTPERKLHVPVASDLCQASADLLFSEPPTLSVDVGTITEGDQAGQPSETVTQSRLDSIADAVFHQTLANAAEINAALGDVYLRATWDRTVEPTKPFLTKVDADMAYPEFRFGRLTAVTFWTTLASDSSTGLVYRHLERHETDGAGIGIIEHGLYQGTEGTLGTRIPLTDHSATAGLQVDENSIISTLTPGLDVFHVPNVSPNRAFRKHPIGANLGRSDLDGIEDLLDALDEAYSSLMRDIRLGKAMLVVPEMMLTSNGPGNGASFEQREVFTGIKAAPGSMADAKMQIEQVQFAIRIEEHERSIMLLWNTIVRSAGYSAQTFGEGGDVAMTATEVAAKERRSYLTRDRKIRSFKPALEGVVSKLLAIDAAVFSSGAQMLAVSVDFSDGVQEDREALARTVQLLAAALSASIETRVRMLHNDWDEPAIKAEVEKIRAENAIPELADPDDVGVDGQGLGDQFAVNATA